MTADDSSRASWAEHANDLESEQLALALLRAYLNPAEEDLAAVLDRTYELVLAAAADESDTRLGGFEAALASLAIRFGSALFGDRLDDVLAEMQADVARHVAEYRP